MTRALGNKILKLCFELCWQAKQQGISDLQKFDDWMDVHEKEFEKRHVYVDEDHNEKVRRVCRKIFFLMLRDMVGFDSAENFSRELEKVKI